MSSVTPRIQVARLSLLALIIAMLSACESGLDRVDRRVNSMLADTSARLDGNSIAPTIEPLSLRPRDPIFAPREWTVEQPGTVNPPASELSLGIPRELDPIEETEALLQRLESYSVVPRDAPAFDLTDALMYATEHSREYRFAEEEYLLAGLRLLIERHRWGPRFFNEMRAEVDGNGNDGLFDTALRLTNDLGVTQRLPYGGELSARALARATEDLHERVAGENVQTAEILLTADIPLLRGAGTVAREDRIQRERDLIYAARDFERFRREFLVSIAEDFLSLVAFQRSIENNVRQIESLEQLEERERALYEAGRKTAFDAALAENETVEARDRLNSSLEQYRLAVDRLKIRLGYSIEQPLVIEDSGLDLTAADIDMNQAVAVALAARLDLQTQRDIVIDSRRSVSNAENALLPDLDFSATASIPTDPDRNRGRADFSPGDSEFLAGINFGLPLDREIERANLRQTQIDLERTLRSYTEFRDEVVLSVRGAVREIDRARYSLEIQEQNILIAQRRLASIEADPSRATVRDTAEAVNQLLSAQDARDEAARDLEVALLKFLLESGQLRIDRRGILLPIEGLLPIANAGAISSVAPSAAPAAPAVPGGASIPASQGTDAAPDSSAEEEAAAAAG